MTAAEFMKIIGIIRGAYPHIDRFQDNDVKDVWYECLQDLEYQMARKATINLVKTARDFPPDIATIRSEYDLLDKDAKKDAGAIKTHYESAVSSYPQKVALGYAWTEWQSRAKDGKTAEAFLQVIRKYISECEKNGEDAIDFKQCVKTICRGNDGKIFFKEVEK